MAETFGQISPQIPSAYVSARHNDDLFCPAKQSDTKSTYLQVYNILIGLTSNSKFIVLHLQYFIALQKKRKIVFEQYKI